MNLRNKNIKLLFKYLIIPTLTAWLCYSLYRQVSSQPHLSETWKLMKRAPFAAGAWTFWLAVVLVSVNWGLEAFKWKLLMKPLENMGFDRALKSVLSGITLSVNTPNRIGEYGGRMLYVGEGKKLKSISLSIAGSISQLIVTLTIGCCGLLYLLVSVPPADGNILGLPHAWVQSLLAATMLITVLAVLFYFRIAGLIKVVQRFPLVHRLSPYISALAHIRISLLASVFLISLLRYLVFVLQYMLLFQVWKVHIPWQTEFCLVSVLFLIMAIVPSFAIADLGIRGQFSIALFGMFSTNTIGIISTIFSIWILNIFLPALAGSIVIITTRFFRKIEG